MKKQMLKERKFPKRGNKPTRAELLAEQKRLEELKKEHPYGVAPQLTVSNSLCIMGLHVDVFYLEVEMNWILKVATDQPEKVMNTVQLLIFVGVHFLVLLWQGHGYKSSSWDRRNWTTTNVNSSTTKSESHNQAYFLKNLEIWPHEN